MSGYRYVPRITPGFVLKHGVNTGDQIKQRPGPPVGTRTEYWDLAYLSPDPVTVYEEDPAFEPTGLVDARGVEIVRERVRHPIGFRPGK